MRVAVLLLAGFMSAHVFAQPAPDLVRNHERLLCIVPLIGKGSWADPKRPMFAPVASQMGRGKSGILAFSFEPTDDGRSAIAIFEAVDRRALQPILGAAHSPGVTVFEPGKQTDSQILAALAAVKKDFDLKQLILRVP